MFKLQWPPFNGQLADLSREIFGNTVLKIVGVQVAADGRIIEVDRFTEAAIDDVLTEKTSSGS